MATIELDQEIDGEEIGSRNYRFSKIGEPVPMNSDNSQFDLKCLPSKPLDVSERFRLLFIVHTKGFYVTRTKDVMASAEKVKDKQIGASIQDLCLVDVPIGSVSILTLSADDSMLAAIVDSNVHFFAVSALLHKEQKPSFSVSLDDPSCIKDMIWIRKVAKMYLILSMNGKLYFGSAQGPLNNVMDNVDCVDWSVKGNFIAVTKKNIVSILSSQFEEKLSFSLHFQSAIGDCDYDVNQVIKVDSIRWIRPDCIAVGCFQLNEDGEEENYIVQVITSSEGRIIDAASKPIVLSFNNVFMDFCSDAVPTRTGPHLFLSYMNLHGLAFVANKTLSRQVGLFCWSLDSGKNEAAMIEILNDAWSLHIDYQENGEENVLLGLAIDKVSQNENVKFTLGNEDTEVSPCCVVISLTNDGKVSVFHFASAASALVSPEGVTSDEEDNPTEASLKYRGTFSKSESHEVSSSEIEKPGAKAIVTNDSSSSSLVNTTQSRDKAATDNIVQKPPVNLQALKVDESTRQNQDSNAGKQLVSKVNSSTGFLSMTNLGNFSSPSASKTEPLDKVESRNTTSPWSFNLSNGRVDASKSTFGRPFSTNSDLVDVSEKPTLQGLQQKSIEKAKPSSTFTSFGNIQTLPSYPVSQVPLREVAAASGRFLKSEFNKESSAASSQMAPPHSLQNASKQFGNVGEMAKKLDILLEGIEGKGGFHDATITSQENLVIELENEMWALSNKCKMWRGVLDDKSKGVQLLLDKSAQVIVRKSYLEGVFKQATDSRYLDLWNRQKLSSELELKRRRVLNLNQELTNQLIKLERHFNSLEFNKFGENVAVQRNGRALQSWQEQSRPIHSFQSLHYTINAQLAAAEQLSGHLSKQMSSLSIESCKREHDIKTKIFESIGLSDSRQSPAMSSTYVTPSNKEQSVISRSRRHQASLNWSCASSETPKTTVKRMLLKEDHLNGSSSRSWSSKTDRQYLTPQSHKKFEVPRSAPVNYSAGIFDLSRSRDNGNKLEKQSTLSPSTTSFQRTPANSFSAFPAQTTQNSGVGISTLDSEELKSSVPFITGKNDSFAASESKAVPQSDPSLSSVSFGTLDHSKIGFTKSTTVGDQKDTWIMTESVSSEPKFLFTPAPAFSPVTNASEKGLFTGHLSSIRPSSPFVPNTTEKDAKIETKGLFTKTFENNLPSMPPYSPVVEFEALKSLSPPHVASTTEKDVKIQPSPSQSPVPAATLVSNSNLGPSKPTTNSKSGSGIDSGASANNDSSAVVPSIIKPSEEKESPSPIATSSATEIVVGSNIKNVMSDASSEEMDEEDMDETTELSLGSLSGFGLGAPTSNSTTPTPKPNPFGAVTTSTTSSPFTLPYNSSGDQLFRPASFNYQLPTHPPTPAVSFSSPTQVSAVSGFGQQAQIGSGQQALGSVLGAFGQSRQIGSVNVASASGFGGGFMSSSSPPSAPAPPLGGGFASLAAKGGGFASLASPSVGGGFASHQPAAAAGGGGGFAGAGFNALATSGVNSFSGGGFGAFSNQPGVNTFSSFGATAGSGTGRPQNPNLFTQMRK